MKKKRLVLNDAKKDELAERMANDENLQMQFAVSVNCCPPNNTVFEPADGLAQFNEATVEEKMEMFKKNAKILLFPNDHEKKTFKSYHLEMLRKIRKDPELKGYYEYRDHFDEDLPSHAFMAYKLWETIEERRKEDGKKWPKRKPISFNNKNEGLFSELSAKFAKDCYVPPNLRVLITENLTFNKKNYLPVFCDVKGLAETPSEHVLKAPDSLVYFYADQNFAYSGRDEMLGRAAVLSNEEENKIVCDCCSREPIVPCSSNADCPCNRMNKKFRRMGKNLQKERGMDEFTAKITTFDPIYFNPKANVFFDNMAYACCSECACKGKCTNNPLLLIEKHLFPLELYRNNDQMGFGIRSYSAIPAGTPMMEFVGEIIEEKHLKRENIDYAYRITDTSESKVWETILDGREWSEEYAKLLKKFSKKQYYIDPKHYGNVGRTAAHSCTSNAELLRVFQKSLSPLNIRLVFVSLEHIFPGTPITLDYGSRYVEDQIGGNCLCNSIGCVRHLNSPALHMTKDQLEVCFRSAGIFQKERFEEILGHKIEERPPRVPREPRAPRAQSEKENRKRESSSKPENVQRKTKKNKNN